MTPKQAAAKLRKARETFDKAAVAAERAVRARHTHGTYSTYEARAEKHAAAARAMFDEVEAWILEQSV